MFTRTWRDLSDRLLESIWTLTTPRNDARASADLDPKPGLQFTWPSSYQWGPAHQWVSWLERELHRRAPLSREGIPQSFPGVVVFRARFHGLEYPIAVDYSDYAGVNEDCAGLSALYFKMQFDKGGYGADHVVPGGFVPRGESIYSYIAHLRAIRDRMTFRHEVYGRFGGGFATDVRTKAVEILRNQNRFGFEGGLGTVRYSRALREVASSKVCIDLPGNGGFCFRLIDYFAVGACVISYPHPNRLPEPLVDRTHIVYCQEDMSDLAELCEHYLKNDEEREAVQQQSRAYFDAHLHRQRLAAYYLDHIVRRLEQLS